MPKAKSRGFKSQRRDAAHSNFLEGLVNTEKGVMSPRVFFDPEIYSLEQERVFTQCWLFVAHESEISQPGDFVTRTMGEDPVIVWRGQDGKVRVFLNVCRHRGRRVCGEDLGKAAHFRCPYHGWTYSNCGELNSLLEGLSEELDSILGSSWRCGNEKTRCGEVEPNIKGAGQFLEHFEDSGYLCTR